MVHTAIGGAYQREDGVYVAPINLLKPIMRKSGRLPISVHTIPLRPDIPLRRSTLPRYRYRKFISSMIITIHYLLDDSTLSEHIRAY